MDKKQQIKSRNPKFKEKPQRPFSIEKIAKSINCGDLIKSIKYKYIDPKIRRKKEKTSRNKIVKRIQDKLDEEMYSARKIKYRKYKHIKEPIFNSLSYRQPSSNYYLKKKNSEFILPLIIKNKKINESYNQSKKEDNNLISTSGMINRKRLTNLNNSKMTISALLNILKDKKEREMMMGKNYKSLDDIHNINAKYNLNLNTKNKNNISKNKIKYERKLTKNGLLANLFHKYSAVNNNKANISLKIEEKNEMDDHSSNVSFDLGKEICIINSGNSKNNSNSDSTFLTKLRNRNDNIDISKIINRHNNLIWSIKKNNNKIIDKDKNIYINCLLSRVQSKLNRDKIFYRNNGKTIYELDKEFSYRRLKHFENIINKLFDKGD